MNFNKSSSLLSLGIVFSVAGLVACGDDITTEEIVNNSSVGLDMVVNADSLPDCTSDNEGSQVFVRDSNQLMVCSGEKWIAVGSNSLSAGKDTVYLAGDTVYLSNGDFSCTTKKLPDDSGLKIICNGDSIGVVLNGASGSPGNPGSSGKGCSIVGSTVASVTIKCGDDEHTLNLNDDVVETEPCDETDENCDVSVSVELSGMSQKGPFLRGSMITAYELNSGRSLKQTGKSFQEVVVSDSGYFNIRSVKLASQYAYLVAEGNYRNEVSGHNSSSAISLRALTELRTRSKANVNVLTHMEYTRMAKLIVSNGYKFRDAKQRAERELLNAFGIDTSKIEERVYAEDMAVFGEGEGNAALLAISVLVQGDRNEGEMMDILANISGDMIDGSWDDSATRADLAYWAAHADMDGRFETIRKNVESWKLGVVPAFEKNLRSFWNREYGLGECGNDANPVGTVAYSKNENSEEIKKDYAADYMDTTVSKHRFICSDKDSLGGELEGGARWRKASDAEKDLAAIRESGIEVNDGEIVNGPISGKTLAYYQGSLREAKEIEVRLNKSCFKGMSGVSASTGMSYMQRLYCVDGKWVWGNEGENAEAGSFTDARDGQQYWTTTIIVKDDDGKMVENTWMAQNLNYPLSKEKNCYYSSGYQCEKFGKYYSWREAVDGAGEFSSDAEGCGTAALCGIGGNTVRGICPEGWHLPTYAELSLLDDMASYDEDGLLMTEYTWDWRYSHHIEDSYGFAMVASGYCRTDDSKSPTIYRCPHFTGTVPAGYKVFDGFNSIGKESYIWSSRELAKDSAYAWRLSVVDYDEEINSSMYKQPKTDYMPVRCVKD